MAVKRAMVLSSCLALLLRFLFLLGSPASPSGVADKIFYNGVIYTGDQSLPWADSFAIKSGRILDIGSLAQVQNLVGSQTERENLQGRFIIPGFVDSHVHLIHAGMQMAKLDLHNVAKKEDFISKVQNYVQGSEEDKWILGGGWNNDLWGGELPNKSWIDSHTINNPVWFVRMDGHMGLANSVALLKAGITRNTPDPPGGHIVKDELGDPTGVILETAMLLMASCVPKTTIGERRDALIRASKYALSKGVTAVTDFGRFIPGDPTTQVWDDFNEVYKWADASGSSLIRVCVFFPLELCRRLSNIVRERGRHVSQWLQIGGLKAFADGSLGSRTALFHEPYEDDPQNFGVKIANSEWLLASLLEADSLDLQVAVHAIGDAANDMVLSAYEEVASVSISSDRRFRIEHAQHLSTEAPSRFRLSQTIASIQPQHILVDALVAARKLGEERAVNGSFLLNSLLDNGVKLALGSDWPVVSLNPLDAIKAAVDRCPDGWNTSWIPSERIGIEYALRGLGQVKELVEKRWNWMRRPIHGIATLLHPLWKSNDLFMDVALLEARDAYLSRIYSEEEQMKIDSEISMYQNNVGVSFSRSTSRRREICVKPIEWWETYGYSTPHIRACALRILSQDCSSGACERNWSSYSLIHTKIRNRLKTTQLEKLVYCRANLRLLRKLKTLAGPMQVDPTKIEVSADQPIAVHDVDEGLYSELHRELETIDRRVTRAHSRARSHTHVSLAVRARGRGRGRGCQIRRGSGSRVVTYARRGDRNASPDTIPVDEESGSSSSSFEELMEPEFDSDGNIVTDGDYGSASSTFEEESNSTSDSNSD